MDKSLELFDNLLIKDAFLQPVWGTVKYPDGSFVDWSLSSKPDDHLVAFGKNFTPNLTIEKAFVSYNNSYGNIYHLLREWFAAMFVFYKQNLKSQGYKLLLPNFFNGINYADNALIKNAINFFELNSSVIFLNTRLDCIFIKELIYPKVLSGCFYPFQIQILGSVIEKFSCYLLGDYSNYLHLKPKIVLGYLSRADSKNREVLNESDFAWNLHKKFGADIFTLSNKSLLEQIIAINSYSFVISPHGAGLSNLSFIIGNNSNKFGVIELMPKDYDFNFYSSIALERDFIYEKFLLDSIDISSKSIHSHTYGVDIEKFNSFFENSFKLKN